MTLKRFQIFLLTLLICCVCSCSTGPVSDPAVDDVDEAAILLNYLESHGDMVNSAESPFLINAEDVYVNLKSPDFLVIDIRPDEEFVRGHIENAVNIDAADILHYFENQIEPNSFRQIVFVCSNAHHSGYVAGIMRMLGYRNIYNMRFGLSAWNEDIANRHWYAAISDDLIDKLETISYPRLPAGKLPVIKTGKRTGYEILREQARIALAIDWDSIVIHHGALNTDENFYIVNYWPFELYQVGHLAGAVQYDPKKSLHSTQDIYTLPSNIPVIIYCYTGHTSSYVNAFLAVMGYKFRSLEYSANGFAHSFMQNTQPPGRWFSARHVKNYPLVTND